MTIYTVDKEKDANPLRLIQRVMFGGILFLIIYLVAVTVILYEYIEPFLLLFLGITLLCLLLFFYLPSMFRKLQESWSSTEIELGNDYLIQRQIHRPEINIHRNEITKIFSRKGLSIHTKNNFRFIFIPDNLEHFEEVKSKVAEWVPVETPSKAYYIRYVSLPLLFSLGILLSTVLTVLLRSAWPILIVIMFMMSRIVYFGWVTWQRADLIPPAKRWRTVYYSISLSIFFYFFVVLLLKLVT